MIARYITVVTLASILTGCASERTLTAGPIVPVRVRPTPHHPVRRQMVSETRPAADPTIAEDNVLNSIDPRSAEWRVAYARIEADRDKRLAAKLVICRGCLPIESNAKETTALSAHLPTADGSIH
jgi:hypothetical protein